VRITEPVTLVTDYVMGAIALVLAVRLFGDAGAGSHAAGRLWAGALAMTAAASLIGGTYHGFVERMSGRAGRVTWMLAQLAAGLASACLLAAAVLAVSAGALRIVLLAVAGIKLLLFARAASRSDEFLPAIVDYGTALLAILLAAWFIRPSGLTPAAGWITAGVALSAMAGLIQWARIAPHRHFNHNDLFHVVQSVALYLLYRGGLLVSDMG